MYHAEDDTNYHYNAKYTTYQSFLRQALSQLNENAKNLVVDEKCQVPQEMLVKEVTVFQINEIFKGLIVTLKDEVSRSLSPPEFEVYFAPIDYLQNYSPSDEVGRRVSSLEVSRGDNL